MSFEIVFYYHSKKEDGGYEMSETLENVKRLGKTFEEISLEKLAAFIMKEFSRRDIYVSDAKIYEFVRKEVKFKTTKNGDIVIGSKKVSLSDNNLLKFEDEEPSAPQILTNLVSHTYNSPPHQPAETTYESLNLAPTAVKKNVSKHGALLFEKKSEIFDPPPDLRGTIGKYRLSVGKQYQILRADPTPIGDLYTIADDTGKKINISDHYFVPIIRMDADIAGVNASKIMDSSSPSPVSLNSPIGRQASNAPNINAADEIAQMDEMMKKMDALTANRGR